MTQNNLIWLLFFFLMAPLTACAVNIKEHNLVISKDITVNLQETTINKNINSNSLPNGEFVFGATKAPTSFVNKIIFKVKNKSYRLESKYMYNAWGNRPLEIPNVIKYFDAHCYDINNCTIRGLFSDAAGSFVAEWKIISGKATRTIITDSSDIISIFSRNISPPVFE